ncbi:MAG: hypothetical protein EHM42_03255, partial [Planctomycetaceae bacterium]
MKTPVAVPTVDAEVHLRAPHSRLQFAAVGILLDRLLVVDDRVEPLARALQLDPLVDRLASVRGQDSSGLQTGVTRRERQGRAHPDHQKQHSASQLVGNRHEQLTVSDEGRERQFGRLQSINGVHLVPSRTPRPAPQTGHSLHPCRPCRGFATRPLSEVEYTAHIRGCKNRFGEHWVSEPSESLQSGPAQCPCGGAGKDRSIDSDATSAIPRQPARLPVNFVASLARANTARVTVAIHLRTLPGASFVTSSLSPLEQEQLRQAEELFFSAPAAEGFAQALFFGRFLQEGIFPWPLPTAEEKRRGDAALAELRGFLDKNLDPAAVDRNADIPLEFIRGLGEVGVLGATVSREHGGRGLSQHAYCRLMEEIGSRCASTAVFVNAHHSIGLRGLELFGSEAQKATWMQPLARGEKLAAFALTEPEAGSDAANVRTTASASPDGKGFVLNGEKRYITNGGIAQVLTVMARTPAASEPDGKISAFLVTPDMPGFQVVEARMPKCGIRGTATARLAFKNMYVPRENVLGPIGKGLRVALTVLDFGRTTFGASCTGAAKFCLDRAVAHAKSRRQFGRTLGEFDLVRQKIASAAAHVFAMESATFHTAALIDKGAENYMLETAMLKVFASESLWTIVNDTLQIYGGAGYFTDQPFERMMRDARINMIGEGANDVLRCFVAGVGLRHLGQEMLEVKKSPWKIGLLRRPKPAIPVASPRFQPVVSIMASQIHQFARACQVALLKYREGVIQQQLVLARLGDIATELFIANCVYARLFGLMSAPNGDEHATARQLQSGLLYLKIAGRRNDQRLAELR